MCVCVCVNTCVSRCVTALSKHWCQAFDNCLQFSFKVEMFGILSIYFLVLCTAHLRVLESVWIRVNLFLLPFIRESFLGVFRESWAHSRGNS